MSTRELLGGPDLSGRTNGEFQFFGGVDLGLDFNNLSWGTFEA